MTKKRAIVYGIVAAMLVVLVDLQFRSWGNFDWGAFWQHTNHVDKLRIASAVGLIYLAHVLRAVRWKIFLGPIRPTTQALSLVAPTMIGFGGLAMLGRPGELIRPYLIARKEGLTLSSQLAIWSVERLFDLGAFAFLFLFATFLAGDSRELAYYRVLRQGGVILAVMVGLFALTVVAIARHSEGFMNWIGCRFSATGTRLTRHLRGFVRGMSAIHGLASFAQLTAISLLMWYVIALAYLQVTHAYMVESLRIPISQVVVLMSFSLLGSLLQLPGVGGGPQLATIAGLEHLFHAPHEIAASCGILLWLVTVLGVVPIGLLLAQQERFSFRGVARRYKPREAGEVCDSV